MGRIHARRPLVLSLALSALALGACGGSGGSGTSNPAALFNGVYGLASVGLASEWCSATWGEARADGRGTLTLGCMGNSEGIHVDPWTQEQSYTVDSGRVLKWQWPYPEPHDDLAGGISRDGGLAALVPVGEGSEPALTLVARMEQSSGPQALVGTWHVGILLRDTSDHEYVGACGLVTLDALGAGELTYTENREGEVWGPSTLPMTCTFPGEGALQVDLGGLRLVGRLAEGGQLLLAGGGTGEGTPPTLLVMVRAGQGLTNAALSGRYATVGVEPRMSVALGRAEADGAGGLAFDLTVRDAGSAIGDDVELAYEYQVAGNGMIAVLDGATTVWRGSVGAGGEFAMLASGDSEGVPPMFFFLIR